MKREGSDHELTKADDIGGMLHDIGNGLRDPTVPSVGVSNSMPRVAGYVMSNFDREVDDDVAEYLKAHPKTTAGYPAWDFNGRVWFDGNWKCEVWQHRCPVEIMEAASPKDLMDSVSEKYGYD
jgi:hypothetical protein